MSASVKFPKDPITVPLPIVIREERDLLKYITRALEGRAHVANIEAHETAAGIPDMSIFMDGRDIWVELKILSDRKPPKMRPTQKRWHRDRWAYGGLSWVIVYDVYDHVLLVIPGHTAATLGPRVVSWRESGVVRNTDEIVDVIRSMVKRTRNA